MSRELFLVRHAIAEDRDEFKKSGLPDTQRPLTPKGAKKMKSIAQWFSSLPTESFDFIAESPLVRSQQTVDILCQSLKIKKRITLVELGPEHPPEQVCKKLDTLKWSRVVLVGHEPHLSHLICYLTGVSLKHYSEFSMKKGGIASFKIIEPLIAKKAQLQWMVTPKIIASLSHTSKS